MLQAIKKNKNNIINYEKIIIFDLDDTLVDSKMKVPRQTYHIFNNFKKMLYQKIFIEINFSKNV